MEQLVSGLELELTVIEAVINSDKERTNLVRCAKALEEALGSGDDTEIAQCFHKIQLDNQKESSRMHKRPLWNEVGREEQLHGRY